MDDVVDHWGKINTITTEISGTIKDLNIYSEKDWM